MSSKESDSRMSVEQQIAQLIATEIAAKATQVVAAIGLLDEGATVPFIAIELRKDGVARVKPPGFVGSARESPIPAMGRSEENRSELQQLMRTSYAVFCLKKKIIH